MALPVCPLSAFAPDRIKATKLLASVTSETPVSQACQDAAALLLFYRTIDNLFDQSFLPKVHS